MTVTLKKKSAPKPKIEWTHVVLLLDDSGSMVGSAGATLTAFNRTLRDIKAQAAKTKQKTMVSMWLFGTTTEQLFNRVPAKDAPELTNFRPDQHQTRLTDALIDIMRDVRLDNERTATLVVGLTDGEENNSQNGVNIARLAIARAEQTKRVTVTMVVPGVAERRSVMNNYGLADGNVTVWTPSDAGAHESGEARARGLDAYFTGRARGETVTRGFYQTDTSKITPRQVKALDDISQDVKVWEVEAEEAIQPFVERKSRAPYFPGTAFYQLSKKEKLIQANKTILIRHRDKGAVYAGDEARALIGLPTGKSAQVEPGRTGDYDVFVQSKSVNRKLVRGTRVIVWRAATR